MIESCKRPRLGGASAWSTARTSSTAHRPRESRAALGACAPTLPVQPPRHAPGRRARRRGGRHQAARLRPPQDRSPKRPTNSPASRTTMATSTGSAWPRRSHCSPTSAACRGNPRPHFSRRPKRSRCSTRTNRAPCSADLYLTMGWARYQTGDYVDALNDLATAQRIAERIDDQSLIAYVMDRIANVYHATDRRRARARPPAARARYPPRARRHDAAKRSSLNNMTYTYLDLGRYEEALGIGVRRAALGRSRGAALPAHGRARHRRRGLPSPRATSTRPPSTRRRARSSPTCTTPSPTAATRS